MSEYIEIEAEFGDDPALVTIYTNLRLADAPETYASPAAMEEGSPVAQALAVVDGIRRLRLDGQDAVIERDPAADWHVIVADVTAVLKDFFL